MTLLEAARKALQEMDDHMYRADTHEFYDAKEALRQAIEQAEQQEPAAWRITDGEGDWEYYTDLPEDWSIRWSARYGRKYQPLYTTPSQQEPLMDEADVLMLAAAHGIDAATAGLYSFYVDCMSTTPPQRKPLTEEQLELLWDKAVDRMEHFCSQYWDFARAIERAHGIKENT